MTTGRTNLAASSGFEYDFFICHAAEDKPGFVSELAAELASRNCRVWFDDFVLTIGDSLRRAIDRGLESSRFGVVVLSPAFFGKKWANAELDGLTQRQRAEVKVILPVWHGIEHDDVAHYSLPLADLLAASSSEGVVGVADKLMEAAGRSSGSTDKLAPLEPGPRFRGELQAPNSTTWALVEVGAVPEGADLITDDLHDAVERAFLELQPQAVCERQLDVAESWRFSPEGAPRDTWQGWLYQGPLAWMIREIPTEYLDGERWLDLGLLARWWGSALRSGADILRAAGASVGVVGFALYPYASEADGISGITSLRLMGKPASARVAQPHTTTPWVCMSSPCDLDRLGDSFEAAAASLLRAFSYRHVDGAVGQAAELARAEATHRPTRASAVPELAPATMRADEGLTLSPLSASVDSEVPVVQAVATVPAHEVSSTTTQSEAVSTLKLAAEHAARFASGGPVYAAFRWVSAVWKRNDLREAWVYMDLPLRAALVHAWALANRTHPFLRDWGIETVIANVHQEPDGPAWAMFADTQLREFQTAWPGFDPLTWGAASKPRRVLPDYDLVLLVDTGGTTTVVDKPTEVTAVKLLMHKVEEDWLLAGFSEVPA